MERLRQSFAAGRKHALVVVAEGIKNPEGKHAFATNGRTFAGVSSYFTERLAADGFNVRSNVLGHIQRAGTPIAEDRLLASAFAVRAIELLAEGQNNRVVVYRNGRVQDEDLDEILKLANTPVDPNGAMVNVARSLGIYVGEK